MPGDQNVLTSRAVASLCLFHLTASSVSTKDARRDDGFPAISQQAEVKRKVQAAFSKPLYAAAFLITDDIGITSTSKRRPAAEMKDSKIWMSRADAVLLSGCHWTPRQNQSSETDS